jgi:transcriptional regulator with XRE-family HTH domain
MQVERIKVLLREAKTRKKMTINEIAAKSNVGIRTVNRIFAGQDVRFSSLIAVLEALELTLYIDVA